jgi:hypothetical protein
VSNPSVVSLQLAALVANGICLSQTPGAAGDLTIAGSLATCGVATLDVPRRVAVSSTGNDAAVVFTITGTNANGSPLVATVTGANVSTVQTAVDFRTVTRVQTSAATVGAITVGTNGVASSPWVLDNHLATVWALTVAVSIVSGAVTYTVEHTYDDPNDIGPTLTAMPEQFALTPAGYVPPLAWPHGTLQGKSTSGEGTYADQPIMAHRLTITAGTGRAVMQSIQAGID